MKRKIILALTVAGLASGGAIARPPGAAPSQILDPLFACGGKSVPEARLKCYDEVVALLQKAVATHDVVVSGKAQIQETRRTLFGLSLPSLAIFNNDDTLAQIESTLDHASTDNYGHFTFVLADGATWRQIDDNVIVRQPRKGDVVVVKRAALGSFKLSVRGQSVVRVHRQN